MAELWIAVSHFVKVLHSEVGYGCATVEPYIVIPHFVKVMYCTVQLRNCRLRYSLSSSGIVRI